MVLKDGRLNPNSVSSHPLSGASGRRSAAGALVQDERGTFFMPRRPGGQYNSKPVLPSPRLRGGEP